VSRLKLSEYKAKAILYHAVGRQYDGISINANTSNENELNRFFDQYPLAVLKVDQAIKKRNKLGLVKLNVDTSNVDSYINEFTEMGYTYLLLEPMIDHDKSDEHYLSFEIQESGIKLLYSPKGGVEVEENKESIQTFEMSDSQKFRDESIGGIDSEKLNAIIDIFHAEHMVSLEINPYTLIDGELSFLDAAVQVDGSAEFFSSNWTGEDIRTAFARCRERSSLARCNKPRIA
jgi:succinyl-CoA synthetase beta subunit